ncbi:hypothetical protein [Streptomyces sp. NPDC087437]|uniref:hypothetical protein n=1 Tax=Streptomyces sp. NPDC087437 TaxID=3365789 RepID=UPI0037F4D8A6
MTAHHPKHEQIRALLDQGLNNAVIARELDVDDRAVGRIRREAGLPPAPRTSWTRRRHPQERTIRVLLDEGYTNTDIGKHTGADVATIARIRAEGGFGPATITRRGKRKHPKHDAILQLLEEGRSTAAVARELRADRAAVRRIRNEANLPVPAPQPLTLQEKWEERTRHLDGGHLQWTGEHSHGSSTPVLRHRGKTYTAAGVAFRQRTGRDPVGPVKAECDIPRCVAPDHVEDEPGRQRLREQLRYLRGMGKRRPFCANGHDQEKHGRYERDGRSYCKTCKANRHPADAAARPRSPEEV